MRLDPERVSTILREVAAQEILPRFRALAADDIREKAPGDVVTVADEIAERELSRRLSALMPGSVILGEEGAARDPGLRRCLAGADPVWVVDPIDGTANFAAGRVHWAVIVALVQDGTTQAGWIHEPLSGRSGWAVRGGGGAIDGAPLQPLRGDKTGLVGRLTSKTYGAATIAAVEAAGPYRCETPIFCAGSDYLDLASGRIDFLAFRRGYPWDHAAGLLLHEETGGAQAHLDGARYDPARWEHGVLCAPNKGTWGQLAAALAGL